MDNNLVKDYVNVSLEEYKTLREEVKQSNINQFQSLSFGSAAIGVLLSAGFYSWDKTLLTTFIIFSLFVPLLSFLSTFLWLGEIARMIRAGNFIVFIEKKMEYIVQVPPALLDHKDEFDVGIDVREPLSWERYLRAARGSGVIQGHMLWVHRARLWIFPAVAMVSWGVGSLYLFLEIAMHNITFPAYFIAPCLVLLFVWIYLFIKIVRVFHEITKR
jgi:hypothetical protein